MMDALKESGVIEDEATNQCLLNKGTRERHGRAIMDYCCNQFFHDSNTVMACTYLMLMALSFSNERSSVLFFPADSTKHCDLQRLNYWMIMNFNSL
jgi:hypothetical protein